jgi:hypothetical protein
MLTSTNFVDQFGFTNGALIRSIHEKLVVLREGRGSSSVSPAQVMLKLWTPSSAKLVGNTSISAYRTE